MIIVEGMDNTGKTTLIKKLSLELGLEIRHSPSHLVGSPDLYTWVDEELAQDFKLPPIYDRFPLISEAVYGPILRGVSTIPKGKYDGWAASHDVLFIYCRPGLNRILNWGHRDQMKGVMEHAKALVAEYDDVMFSYRTRGWGVVKYDYEDVEAFSKVHAVVRQYKVQYKQRKYRQEDWQW
jgi:hypothetical protein